MFKERARGILRMIRLLDMFIAGLVFIVSSILFPFEGAHRFAFRDIMLFAAVIAIWGAILSFLKVYTVFWMRRFGLVLFSIAKATLISIVVMSGTVYIFKINGIMDRDFIAITFLCIGILLSLEKIIVTYFIKNHCWSDYNTKKVLIIGTNSRARNIIDLIDGSDEWGVKVVGIVDRDPGMIGKKIGEHSVIGDFSNLENILHNNVIDEVVFVLPRGWLVDVEELVRLCELEGVTVNIAVDHFEPKGSRVSQTDIHGVPMLTIESAEHRFYQNVIKRCVDLSVSFSALLMLSPLLIIVAILIKLTSRGPVFFKQDRIGLNGRRVKVWKFRTMEADAEAKRDGLLAMNEMGGPVFKITNDPRVTKIGTFLRKTSIDELPQLFVVLKGDMSLVGPRPLPIKENQYELWQRRRLSVKPGITCIWQISGRNNITDFCDWVKLDLDYIDKWSLKNDFLILLRTIPAVLFVKGAK